MTGDPHALQLLLVDDDEVDRSMVRRMLRREGAPTQVTEAADADAALAALRGGSFDCVVLDLWMPHRDGLWLLRKVRADGVDVPVVLLAGQADETTVVESMKAGASDYLIKSALSPARLWQTIRQAIGVYRAERAAAASAEALRQSEERLRQALELEQQLVGIVSHDLRNPLSAMIMTAAFLLQRQSVDAQMTRSLQRIVNSGNRAVRLIRDLLDLTQVRMGGGLRIEPRPGDLHEIARQAVEEMRSANPGREVVLSRSGNGHGDWDADRVAQIVTNLVDNALRHGDAGTPVQIATIDEGDGMRLEVHNFGEAIREEDRAALFEPFRRGEAGEARARSSVGLGLYIVDQLVRAHGGAIEVLSSEGEGTTFRLRLPRRGIQGPVT
jgi:signal transduction histidine kinase